jgi:hypothetical protein
MRVERRKLRKDAESGRDGGKKPAVIAEGDPGRNEAIYTPEDPEAKNIPPREEWVPPEKSAKDA